MKLCLVLSHHFLVYFASIWNYFLCIELHWVKAVLQRAPLHCKMCLCWRPFGCCSMWWSIPADSASAMNKHVTIACGSWHISSFHNTVTLWIFVGIVCSEFYGIWQKIWKVWVKFHLHCYVKYCFHCTDFHGMVARQQYVVSSMPDFTQIGQ